MKKYWQVFITVLQEAFTYRGHQLIWVFGGLFWVAVLPFVWLTVMKSSGTATIGGLDITGIFTYFFFVPIMMNITDTYVYDSMETDVKDGRIYKVLLRPVKYPLYHFANDKGWSLSQSSMMIIVMGVLYATVLHRYVVIPTPHLETLLLIPMLLLGMMLYYVIGFAVGLATFFTTRVEWAKHVWWMVAGIAAGSVAPINFFPPVVEQVLRFSPFPLAIEVPVRIVTQQISTDEVLFRLAIGLVWLVGLSFLTWLLWRVGIRRVESVGI